VSVTRKGQHWVGVDWFAGSLAPKKPISRHNGHGSVDSVTNAMSSVTSTGGLALMPAYAKNLLPPSVVSCPLEGEVPTIDVAVGHTRSNASPILELFLSRLDELVALP
jgi:LysR family hca operon transcriptional activator